MCFQLLMGTIRRGSHCSSQLLLLMLLMLLLLLLLLVLLLLLLLLLSLLHMLLQLLLMEMCLLGVLVVQCLLRHELIPHDVVARHARTERAIARRIHRLVLLLDIHVLLAAMGSQVLHLRFHLHLGCTRLRCCNRLRLRVRLRLHLCVRRLRP